ncbi:DUF998 domain-containing protein [Homoserinimonas sp. A520]
MNPFHRRDPSVAVARRLDSVAAAVGCALVLTALSIIWAARLSIGRDVYVSVMGATGMPTAGWFQFALVLVALGGGLIAFAARDIRVSPPVLRWWPPAVSLGLASFFFFLASQVTCTPGCPLPYGPEFTWPDFTHTTSAILAFALACWAMLQLTRVSGRRMMAALSLCCGVAVALIAGAGGLMSLANWEVGLGSRFEFAAATIAILWLVSLGVVIARPNSPLPAPGPGIVPFRRRVPVSPSASSRPDAGATVSPP